MKKNNNKKSRLLDYSTLLWIRHWAVRVEAHAEHLTAQTVVDQLIERVDKSLEHITPVPEENTIHHLQKQLDSAHEEIEKMKRTIHSQENLLEEERKMRVKTQEEIEALRKDCRKSDWFKQIRTRDRALAKRNSELMSAVGSLNVRVAQYENKYGKL